MPQRDRYHAAVRQALIADGWVITHDPYFVELGERYGFIDLGATLPLAAEREGQRIAVEVKSFVGASPVADLANAIGQYLLYRSWIARVDPGRALFLAIDTVTAAEVFGDVSARVLIDDYAIKLLEVDILQARIAEWRN
jgi:hypothetical protein